MPVFPAFHYLFISSREKGMLSFSNFVPVTCRNVAAGLKYIFMLLQNFSWQDFLLAAAVFSLVWYLVVWLLYFRGKQVAFSSPLPHKWQDKVDDLDEGIMGRPVLAQGESEVSAEDFGFAPVSKDEQLGVLPDVQEEIKTACRQLEAELGGKEMFFDLFRGIRERYEIPVGPRDLLNEFIREHVPFYLSESELEDLWL